jgi:hypothetical protein
VQVLWQKSAAAAALLLAVLVLLVVPVASAAPPVHQGYNNGNHGQGRGKDPCDKPHVPGYCEQAPEAPAGLLYPAAGIAGLTLFLGLERRRRIRGIRLR